jgi:2-C-methyl-D-erythritol 4-phosphate cytidylyltransferase
MQKNVLIVAGGIGSRMNSSLPKQFIELAGLPVLMHTINRFIDYQSDISICLVLPENQIDYWKKLCSQYNFTVPHSIKKGGITRFHSVKNGMACICKGELIAIHDGVRPLTDIDTIHRCFNAAEEYGAAVPVIELHETLRKTDTKKSQTVDRNAYRLVQTPQVFKSEILLEAYSQDYDDSFTDDASVVESSGFPLTMVDGNRENIKITTPIDLLFAEALLRKNA